MMKHFAIIMVAALGALLATVPGALAHDTICTSNLTGVTIVGNVIVPNGQSCTLGYDPPASTLCCGQAPPGTVVTVTGNVMVGQGSSLTVGLNSIISGNILANNCNYVELVSEGAEFVGGNVQIVGCQGQTSFLSTGTDSQISGNLQCEYSGACVLEGADVSGNVQVMNGVSGSPSEIYDNTINENLQCYNNRPPPIGSNNVVSGNEQGQCAGF